MSAAVLDENAWEPAANRGAVQRLGSIVRWIAKVLLSPLRLFLSVRRSMTYASVTLLLIGITTVNIVWGYPWSGMFSACSSLLIVGWAINRIMRPKLKLGFSLPNSSPAGHAFPVVTHIRNLGRLPAMDMAVTFSTGRRRRRSKQTALTTYHPRESQSSLAIIHPAERTDLGGSLVFERRGVHPLPDVLVTSTFPFYLFQSSQRYPSETQIAITPRLITGEEDTVARGMLNTLGGWSRRLLSGDALDYTGSREYQSGMSVRRWDFSSWRGSVDPSCGSSNRRRSRW